MLCQDTPFPTCVYLWFITPCCGHHLCVLRPIPPSFTIPCSSIFGGWGRGGLHPLRCGQKRFIIITAATGLLPPETKKTSEETLQSSRCGKSHLGLQRTFCCGIINACFARHSFDVSSRLSLNDGAVFYFFLLICRWNGPVRIEPFRLFSNMRRLKNDSYPAV